MIKVDEFSLQHSEWPVKRSLLYFWFDLVYAVGKSQAQTGLGPDHASIQVAPTGPGSLELLASETQETHDGIGEHR